MRWFGVFSALLFGCGTENTVQALQQPLSAAPIYDFNINAPAPELTTPSPHSPNGGPNYDQTACFFQSLSSAPADLSRLNFISAELRPSNPDGPLPPEQAILRLYLTNGTSGSYASEPHSRYVPAEILEDDEGWRAIWTDLDAPDLTGCDGCAQVSPVIEMFDDEDRIFDVENPGRNSNVNEIGGYSCVEHLDLILTLVFDFPCTP